MRRPSFEGLWRHADFRRLWIAQTVSQFGTQVTLLALPLAAVLVLDASAFEVAVLGFFDFLPFLVLSLPAGVWVDRLPRRPVLIVSDVGRALVLATVPLAAALDGLTIWQLYAVGFLAGTFTVFFDVAYQSYLPGLVRREELVEGNQKLEVSRSAAQIGGPGASGLLVAAVTAPYALLADAVSFLFSALLIGRIRKREPPLPAVTESPSMRRELVEGLRFILGDPRWRAIAAYVSSINFFQNVAFALLIVYAVRELGLSAAEIGLVFAVGNVGGLAAAALTSRISARLGIGPTLVLGGALTGLPFVAFPLAPKADAIPVLIAAEILITFGIVLYNVTSISLLQALTPDRLLGRMTASRRFIVWGVVPLGALAGGGLATWIGVRETMFVGSIAGAFSFLFLLAPSLRSIRDLPDAPVGTPAPALEPVARA